MAGIPGRRCSIATLVATLSVWLGMACSDGDNLVEANPVKAIEPPSDGPVDAIEPRSDGPVETIEPRMDGPVDASSAVGGMLDIHAGDRIVMLGDSLTADHYKWWSDLQRGVDQEFARRGLPPPTWIQSGEPGNRTTHIEGNEKVRIIDHRPDVVICFVGINDIGNLTTEASRRSYDGIWRHVLPVLPGLRAMMVSPWIRDGTTLPTNGDTPMAPVVRELRTAFAELARERGIPFVDLRESFDSLTDQTAADRLSSDGLHPSLPAGSSWISAQVRKQIRLQ
jgi:lysophospholipase L1-like esterase